MAGNISLPSLASNFTCYMADWKYYSDDDDDDSPLLSYTKREGGEGGAGMEEFEVRRRGNVDYTEECLVFTNFGVILED